MSSRAPADATPVSPAARAAGRVRVPGDKSISHRYALLAALADGDSLISGYSSGADCAATLACLRALGVAIDVAVAGRVRIAGRGVRGLAAPAGPLDAANSGTTLRLLSGILAAHPFESTIGGDRSLNRRPMRRVIDPLTRMGARVTSDGGCPPLGIAGTDLHGIAHRPEVPSAQVKSAVLLAGLQASGRTRVVEPAPTRDHTERALHAFGARVDRVNGGIEVEGGQRLTGADLAVPGDVSGAVFWAVLAAGTPGADITIEHVGLNPTRTAVFDVLRRAGAVVDATPEALGAGEPVGALRIAYGTPRSFEVTPAEVPGVIDELPALAALAAMQPAGCTFTVRGAAELRVKESDRISALAAGLRALGAAVEEFEDGFAIEARPLSGGMACAVGDHRLAMAFAIAATRASAPSVITSSSAVDVSYPGFFADLQRLTGSGGGR
jgi:3-phosphoshikimate 1-carboxyvinyltransferase